MRVFMIAVMLSFAVVYSAHAVQGQAQGQIGINKQGQQQGQGQAQGQQQGQIQGQGQGQQQKAVSSSRSKAVSSSRSVSGAFQAQGQGQSANNEGNEQETKIKIDASQHETNPHQAPAFSLFVPQGNDGLSVSTPLGGGNFTTGNRFNQLLALAQLKIAASKPVDREIYEMEYETQKHAFLWIFKGWNPLGGFGYWKPINFYNLNPFKNRKR